jgi:hypothetical protein
MSFIGLPLRLEMLATRKATWRVMSAYTYKGDEFSVAVPAAWVTDLTSIPWWIPFLRREGNHTPASVVHDVVYAKGTVTKDGQAEEVDRLFADKEVYFRAMEVRNTPPLRRNVIYWGVRLGGWYSWGRYRRKQRREEVEGKVAIEIEMLPREKEQARSDAEGDKERSTDE